jgi:DNA-directed RNA polymerase beta subunit
MSGGLDRELLWSVIDAYFKDNEQCLVCHHTESYNDFLNNGIYRVFRDNNENNPISIDSDLDEKTGRYRSTCKMFLGGKDGSKVYFGKPVIYDEGHAHYMFPNEARIRNMSYEMTIHYDIDIEFEDILEPGEEPSLVGGEFMRHVDAGRIEVVDGGEENPAAYYKSEEAAVDAPKTPTDHPAPEPDSANPLAKGGAPKKRKLQRDKISLSANTAADIKAIMEKSVSKHEDDSRAIQRRSHTLERVYLGKLPIMVQSKFCILHGMTPEARHSAGECKHDLGGYFIIDGKEKTIVPQEKFGDNMLYVRASK